MICVGMVLEIPTPGEMVDHARQMRNEKDEAICATSDTERHVFQIGYDANGRCNYERGAVVNCEACGKFITQDGARWVALDDKPYLLFPGFVIQEQDAIEDVL
jgi:hypothetical protein